MVVTLALASPARAVTTHPLLGSFGLDGTEESEFPPRPGKGGLAAGSNMYLGFDQSDNRLFVLVANGEDANAEEDKVCRFGEFDPEIVEAPPLDFVAVGDYCLDGFALGDSHRTSIDVDSSTGTSAGNFYVVDQGIGGFSGRPQLVYGFSSSGEMLGGQFPISGSSEEDPEIVEPKGVAVDSFGNVWVADGSSGSPRILEYDASGEATGATVDVSNQSTGRPNRIAFDSTDNLYVGFGSGLNPEIWKYTAPNYTFATQIDAGSVSPVVAMTIDTAKDHLFVVRAEDFRIAGSSDHVVEYDIGGADCINEIEAGPRPCLVSKFAEGQISGANGFQGIAVDVANEHIYVSNGSSNVRQIHVFGTETTEPIVKTLATTEIEITSAIGNGTVNPQGFELTGCRFEVVPKADSEGFGGPGALEFPCETEHAEINEAEERCTGAETQLGGPGDIPPDDEPHCVSAEFSGLEPATVYRYRLSATSEEGAGVGQDREFATSGPVVFDAEVSNVAYTEARLAARIDTQEEATTYRFQYGTEGPCSKSPCTSTPEILIPAGEVEPSPARVVLKELEEGTTYHFRAVASFVEPEVVGTSPDLTFTTYTRPPGPDSDCPNAQHRSGPSLRLPECRAYEQVSPRNKGPASASPLKGQASVAGNALAFVTQNQAIPGCAGATSTNPIISRRSPADDGSWRSECLTTALAPSEFTGYGFQHLGFARDLAVMPFCARASLGLPGDGEGLYVRDNAAGIYLEVPGTDDPTCGLMGISNGRGLLASPAYRRIFFQSPERLTPDAPEVEGDPIVYEWREAALVAPGEEDLRVVSRLPDETPIAGSIFDYRDHAVSEDGERVFWRGGAGGAATVFARTGGETVDLGLSERSPNDPEHPLAKTFVDASTDGEITFFVSGEKLTDDSTATEQPVSFAPSPGLQSSGELYRYDFSAPEGERLTDLTVAPEEPKGAQVEGVIDASADGQRIYFVALGALSPSASSGLPNLYLWDGSGVEPITTHIATLANSPVDRDNLFPLHSRSTPLANRDGKRLLFRSVAPLASGYDTRNRAMVYLYDAPADTLRCISCDPSGEAATANAALGEATGTQTAAGNLVNHQRRNLSANGSRAFFETPDALLPADTNGATDVYMWLAPEAPRCEAAEGCLHLISTGKSARDSHFVDASVSGDDVFFTTRERISPLDKDSQDDVYDARVEGITATAPSSPPDCQGEACLPRAAAPDPLTPASAGFAGPGNSPLLRDCSRAARQVKRLSRSAKRLRRHAKRARQRRQARVMRRKASRTAKRAKRRAMATKRCRAINRRRAGR